MGSLKELFYLNLLILQRFLLDRKTEKEDLFRLYNECDWNNLLKNADVNQQMSALSCLPIEDQTSREMWNLNYYRENELRDGIFQRRNEFPFVLGNVLKGI